MLKEAIFNTEFTIAGNVEILKEEEAYKLTGRESLKIHMTLPDEALLFWPNREGELIQCSHIHDVLDQNRLKTATICYPSTASMFFFLLYNPVLKMGTVLRSPPDQNGRIALFSLHKGSPFPYLLIEAEGIELEIKSSSGKTFEDFVENILTEFPYPTILPARLRQSDYQVQLGFFSPEGKHSVPPGMGFQACVDIAKHMKRYIGENNIIHIFAYHGAHDSNYPEYFPSAAMGGPAALKKAIEGIHDQNQRCSLYMNARLLSSNLLINYPELEDSIMASSKNDTVIETYHKRDFYVMNPLSVSWRSLLIERAAYLKSLGADIIQLDQVAGRAAVGTIGDKWGYGYRTLIENIESLGLEVWIQGINEIYPADRFELCFRQPHILEDGTIRGGHPFGESYPLVPRLLNTQNFIVPLGSKELLDRIPRGNITIDLEHLPGELSLYSLKYMKNLIFNLKKYSKPEPRHRLLNLP